MSSGNRAKERKRTMMRNPKLSSEGRAFAAYHQIKLEKSMNSGARRAQEPIRSDGENRLRKFSQQGWRHLGLSMSLR